MMIFNWLHTLDDSSFEGLQWFNIRLPVATDGLCSDRCYIALTVRVDHLKGSNRKAV
jgi:hypothetical protein